MQLRQSRLLWLLPFLALMAAFFLVWQMGSVAAVPGDGVADTSWFDGFESYTACGEGDSDCLALSPAQRTQLYFPSANWNHSGLQDAYVYTDRTRSGQKSLKMHGLSDQYGGSIAYRAIGGYPPYEISFYAQSNNPDDPNYPVEGGHLKTVGIELSTAPDYTGGDRGLLAFAVEDLNNDGNVLEIRGGVYDQDAELGDGIFLQNWAPNTWYNVTIRYEPVDATHVKISYFIDQIKRGEQTFEVKSIENSLNYIGLWAGNGQVWYDDVTVTASTDPFSFDTGPTPTATVPVPTGENPLYLPLLLRH